jgi:hypothetical protein
VDPAGDRLGARHPVQRRVREHGVERRFVRQRLAVGDREGEGGVSGARRFHHRLGRIDAEDVRAARGDRVRQLAGAGAQVQDPLARARVQEIDQRQPAGCDEAGAGAVLAGVPVLRRRRRFGMRHGLSPPTTIVCDGAAVDQ